MSLDDTTATEYHGPDAVRWFHPDGRTLSLSPSQWEHAQRKLLALTADEQYAYDRKRKAREAAARIFDGEIHKPAATMESLLMEEMAKPLTVYPRHDTGVITLDNIVTDPIYDDLFRLAPTPDAYLTITDPDGTITATFAEDGTLTGGTLLQLKAERDSAEEGERLWRRLTFVSGAALVTTTFLNIGDALGWWL